MKKKKEGDEDGSKKRGRNRNDEDERRAKTRETERSKLVPEIRVSVVVAGQESSGKILGVEEQKQQRQMG